RIDRKSRGRECNAIRHAAAAFVQAENPSLTRKDRRQWKFAELQYCQRQCTAEKGCVDHVIKKMIKPERKGGGCCELSVATTNPATQEEYKCDHKNHRRRSKVHAECLKTNARDQREQEETSSERKRQSIRDRHRQ